MFICNSYKVCSRASFCVIYLPIFDLLRIRRLNQFANASQQPEYLYYITGYDCCILPYPLPVRQYLSLHGTHDATRKVGDSPLKKRVLRLPRGCSISDHRFLRLVSCPELYIFFYSSSQSLIAIMVPLQLSVAVLLAKCSRAQIASLEFYFVYSCIGAVRRLLHVHYSR